MRRERRRAPWLTALLLVTLAGGHAWGLTDEEIFRDFQFNFLNPGARALSLGGAFIAAADDATAAEANPAALHYVNRKEFFVEFRVRETDTKFFEPTQEFGSNEVTSTESFTDFTTVTSFEDADSASFVSFAYPFRIGGQRATIAASRQVVLSQESSLADPPRVSQVVLSQESSLADPPRVTSLDVSLVDFPVVINPGPPPSVERYSVTNTVSGTLDTELINYNLAFSISLTDHFSLGVTGTLAELDMKAGVDSVTQDPDGVLNSIHPRLDPFGGDAPDILFQTRIDDSDSAFGYSIGLHWHPDLAFPSKSNISPVRFGLVYRKGAELEVDEIAQELDPVTFEPPDDPLRIMNVLKVPDRVGVGMSYQTPEHWLFAVDVEYVEYEDLLEKFVTGANFFTSGVIPPTLLNVDANDLTFTVDNATVIHAGVEYAFRSRGQWRHAVRAGYFNAPDNRIRLDSIAANPDRDPTIDAILFDLFRGGEDVDHFTVGTSVRVPLNRRPHVSFDLQIAGNFSDEGNEYLASTVWKFGKIQR